MKKKAIRIGLIQLGDLDFKKVSIKHKYDTRLGFTDRRDLREM